MLREAEISATRARGLCARGCRQSDPSEDFEHDRIRRRWQKGTPTLESEGVLLLLSQKNKKKVRSIARPLGGIER